MHGHVEVGGRGAKWLLGDCVSCDRLERLLGDYLGCLRLGRMMGDCVGYDRCMGVS